MDITDAAQVEAVIALTKPEVIIHTAAMTNVDQCEAEKDACWKQNVNAVEYLVSSCKNMMFSWFMFPQISFLTELTALTTKMLNQIRSVFMAGANMLPKKQ